MAAPVIVGSRLTQATASPVTIDYPTAASGATRDIQAGDLLICAIGSNRPATIPTGWLAQEYEAPGSFFAGTILTRVATSADVSAGSVSVSFVAAEDVSAVVVAASGATLAETLDQNFATSGTSSQSDTVALSADERAIYFAFSRNTTPTTISRGSSIQSSTISPAVQVSTEAGSLSSTTVAYTPSSHTGRFEVTLRLSGEVPGVNPSAYVTSVLADSPTEFYPLGADGSKRMLTAVPGGNATALSVEMWVKTTQTSLGVLASSRGSDKGLGLFVNDAPVSGGGANSIAAGVSMPSKWWGRKTGSTAVNNGSWHHVVATFTKTSGATIDAASFKIYLDGTQVDSADSTYSSTTSPLGNSVWQLMGSTSESGTNTVAGLAGFIAFYPVALTSTQVGNHYTAMTTGGSATLSATTATATATAPTPTLTGLRAGTLAAPAATATAAAQTPTLTGLRAGTLAAPTATATAAAPAATLTGVTASSGTLNAPAATATATAPTPTLTGQRVGTLAAPTATAAAQVPTPTLTGQWAGSLNAPTALATATAPAPTLTGAALLAAPTAESTATTFTPTLTGAAVLDAPTAESFAEGLAAVLTGIAGAHVDLTVSSVTVHPRTAVITEHDRTAVLTTHPRITTVEEHP